METPAQPLSAQAQGAVVLSGDIPPGQVQTCDFRVIGGMDKARLAPIVAATEACIASFTRALHSRLGLACELSLRSSEQVSCRTVLDKASGSYLTRLHLGAQQDIAWLQIDSMLLFPIVDRLLGGSGGPNELSREVTEIEDQIAKEFVRLICDELQVAWQTFGVSVSIGTRQSSLQAQKLYSANDNALVFSFSVSLQSAEGDFQVMLPLATIGAFMGANTISAPELSRRGTISPRFADKLLATTFAIELNLPGGTVPANELLNLSVGKILGLGVAVGTPAVLKIDGNDSFEAIPVRSGHRRGAQLLNRLSQSQPETGSTT
jgi:flagellar motor switch protein FliM